MTGIVTALKTHDNISAFRKPIDNLAFTFITPLGANHHNICHQKLRRKNSLKRLNARSIAFIKAKRKSNALVQALSTLFFLA
jgi:hypothetical protein